MLKHIALLVDFPSWAKWLAVDVDGTIYVYEYKPHFKRSCWDFGKRRWDINRAGRFLQVGRLHCFKEGWRADKTLRRLADYQ